MPLKRKLSPESTRESRKLKKCSSITKVLKKTVGDGTKKYKVNKTDRIKKKPRKPRKSGKSSTQRKKKPSKKLNNTKRKNLKDKEKKKKKKKKSEESDESEESESEDSDSDSSIANGGEICRNCSRGKVEQLDPCATMPNLDLPNINPKPEM